jgi:hypothetical protein
MRKQDHQRKSGLESELFQCEWYERQCRLKHYFNRQRYGYMGIQRETTTACGYLNSDPSDDDNDDDDSHLGYAGRPYQPSLTAA